MKKIILLLCLALLATGCASTQKTAGQGLVSVVAQNVVKIAGEEAVTDLDLSTVNGQRVFVEVTGFTNEFSTGYVLNLIRNQVESQGGLLAGQQHAKLIAEVAINAAGNDFAGSGFIISSTTRSQATVDLTVTIRNAESGERLTNQKIVGYAKYEQKETLGFTGRGKYYAYRPKNRRNLILNMLGNPEDWYEIDDPAYYVSTKP